MQPVSAAWRAETQKTVMGAAECRIVLGLVDTDAASDATLLAADSHPYSAPYALYAAQPPVATLATFEPGRFRLDGRQRVAGEAAGLSEGYLSETVSDETGVFSPAPQLRFLFTKRHTVQALTFTFDAVCDEWPARLELCAFCGDVLLHTVTVEPDNSHYTVRTTLEGFDALTLTFLHSTKPCRRARLQRLLFGEGLVLDTAQLQSLQQKSVADPANRRLFESSVQFKLINANPMAGQTSLLYHPEDPHGPWRYLEQHSPLRLEHGQTLTGNCTWKQLTQSTWQAAAHQPYRVYTHGGTTEWIAGGVYRLSGQPKAEGLYASFCAQDNLTQLTGLYRKGVYAPGGQTLYALAQAVLEDACLPPIDPDTPPWHLWNGLQQLTTTAPLPCRTHRECLQLIAHAACCALYCDREGYLCLQPVSPSALPPYTLHLSLCLQTAEPKTEKTQPLAGVCCPVYTYTPSLQHTQLHSAVYALDGTQPSEGLALWLSFSPAQDITASLSEISPPGSVHLHTFIAYTGAALAVLKGTGTAALTLTGRLLETACTTVTIPTTCEDETAVLEQLDNPLITDIPCAQAVARSTGFLLGCRLACTLETTGHPEIDPLDCLTADTLFTQSGPIQVLQHTLQYEGSLRSTLITKRREPFATQ